nr:RNA polymerase sigma factor [Eubacterium sp.]
MDFEQLYEEYANMLYHYLLGICHDPVLSEDIVQTTFLKAIERSDSFRGASKFSTWLFQIAKNELRDYRKKKERKNVSLDGMLEDGSEGLANDQEADFVGQMLDAESAKKIIQCVHELQEPYKEVFMLHVYGECSYQEIGAVFQKSEVWARVTYFRAKEKIVNMMKGE